MNAQSDYFDAILVADDGSSGQRGRKKRETAHRIFTSAIDLMQKDGFDSVSIEQICKRAGIARATFFQHFASKAALLSVLSDVVCTKLDEELTPHDLSSTERLYVVAAHLECLIERLGSVGPDMLAAFSLEPGSRFHFEQPATGITQRIKVIVETGQLDGVFSKRWRPEDVAISLVASWVGTARNRITYEDQSDDGPLQNAVSLVLNGLTKG